MENLKKLIEKNLVLRVDFSNTVEKTECGEVYGTKYFLIGVLQVAIFYKDGGSEKALINFPLTVAKDPFLRLLQGAKATERHRLKSYERKVGEIVRGLEGAILKTSRDGQFNNREILKILIIKYAGSSNNQNGGGQTVFQECQETSNQANQADSREH
ncbi:MAG: hypothetical protein NT165_01545 [Candidatus Falkowbacteria bacterium]|nr:hypothetical protein [Candidatus Falkowbacteria bacterium]